MNLVKTYCKPYLVTIILMVIFKAVSTLAEIIIPMGFVYMVENIVPQNSKSALMQWGAVMIGIAIFAGVVSILVSRTSVKFGVDFANDLRSDLFDASTHLDCEQIDKFGISSISSRLTMDVTLVQNVIIRFTTYGIRMVIFFVGSLTSITFIDAKLALIMFCTIPPIALTVYITTKASFKRYKETKIINDHLTKTIRDNIMGIRVIKALSKCEFERGRFEEVNTKLQDKSIYAGKVNVIGSPTMNLIVNMGMVGTLIFGAYWVKQGESSPASIIAFMSYATMILNSLVGIGQLFTSFSRAGAAASRINEVLQTGHRVYNSQEKTQQSDAYIEFRDVTFSYDQLPILQNISFKVNKGEMIGIIGITGSGKTTVFNLLLRLYEPDSGEIFVKGSPITSYSPEELYKIFGVVFQSDVIFADTIANNISFGRDIDKESIEFAAQSAQAEPFIKNIPEHYDAMVNIRGQNISGGEKQRLLISRALADKPDILMLDDSTSALDYRTDATLRKELGQNFTDTTKVLVSQRVASIMNAEQILVLDAGKILALGTHKQLLQSCEMYEKIASLQLGDGDLYE